LLQKHILITKFDFGGFTKSLILVITFW